MSKSFTVTVEPMTPEECAASWGAGTADDFPPGRWILLSSDDRAMKAFFAIDVEDDDFDPVTALGRRIVQAAYGA